MWKITEINELLNVFCLNFWRALPVRLSCQISRTDSWPCTAMPWWEKATQAKKLKRLERSLRDVTLSRNYYARRVEILEAIINDIDPGLIPPRGIVNQETFFTRYERKPATCVTEGPEAFSELLLRESSLNAGRHPSGRRWSFMTLVLCFVVRTLGGKAYDYFRHFVTLPCKQTLLNHFGHTSKSWGECLVEASGIDRICRLFRRRHGLGSEEKVAVGIGVDAMSMEPVCIDGTVHNHVFLFELLPLSSEAKSMPLHVMTHVNGNAGPDVLERITFLKASLRRKKFLVRFVATDGDRGYDNMHLTMFSKWKDLYYRHGLDKVIESISDEDDHLIVSDLLHLLKNARSKLLNSKVSVFGDGSAVFDAADVEKCLKLGAALNDYTSKGRMRDIYVLEIFTLRNVIKLFRKGEVAIAFYLLPYALWVAGVMNPGVSCQMRRALLSFVFNVFAEILAITPCIDTQEVSINKKDTTKVQFAFSENHLRRCLNTLVVQLHELEKMPDGLALDRLGTHVLECRFGMIRLQCRHKHNWKMIYKAFTRLILLEDLSLILDHPIVVNKRVNIAGTTVKNDGNCIDVSLPDLSARRLWEATYAVISSKEESQAMDTLNLNEIAPDIVRFQLFIENFLDICAASHVEPLPRMWHGSNICNSTILARLIEFCGKEATQPDSLEMEGEACDDPARFCEMLSEVQCPQRAESDT